MEMNIDDLKYKDMDIDSSQSGSNKMSMDSNLKRSIDEKTENFCSLNVEIDDPEYLKSDPLEVINYDGEIKEDVNDKINIDNY
jgi:hypothetical protein